jgi:hypothetical protein
MEVSGELHAPAALLPWERVSGTPLGRSLGEPQSRSGRCKVREISPATAGNQIPAVPPVAIPTELSRLSVY